MFRVFFFQTFKHEVYRVLKVLVVLAGFRRIYHFKQRRKVLFLVGGFVPDIADKRGIVELFSFYPKILAGFLPVAFGVGDNGIDLLQNVLFAPQIGKGIVFHGFFEVNRIQHFDFVPAPLYELPALD